MSQQTLFDLPPELPPDQRPSVIYERERKRYGYYIRRKIEGEYYFFESLIKGHPHYVKESRPGNYRPKTWRSISTAQDRARQYKGTVARYNPDEWRSGVRDG